MEGLEKLKQELVSHLNGEMAFMPIEKMLNKITFAKLDCRPASLPYSFYEVFYHITFSQNDILTFITDPAYKTPNWPKAYWPAEKGPVNKEAWECLKDDFFNGREVLKNFILSTENNLLSPVKNADNEQQTLLRELMLVVEHTAYHTGSLLLILRLLGLYD